MTSLALKHIEISPAREVRTDDAMLTVVLADGRQIATPLEWYPRLAFATAEERSNWQLSPGGEAVHWPDLDEDISVEGLIAGLKSGEGPASLRTWKDIQRKLRQLPSGFRVTRRLVMQAGRLSAEMIIKRAIASADAWDIPLQEWVVGVATDPFGQLASHGMNNDSPLEVFQAQSMSAARDAARECIAVGMRPLNVDDLASDDLAYVFIFR
jgi:hypothetical protein